jgi:hypothetical protein
MEALPAILDSMRVSFAVTAVLAVSGIFAMTLMLCLQHRILRELLKPVAHTEAKLTDAHG